MANKNSLRYIAGACFTAIAVYYIVFILKGFSYYVLYEIPFIIGPALIAIALFISKPVLAAVGSALCGIGAIIVAVQLSFGLGVINSIILLVVFIMLLIGSIIQGAGRVTGIAACALSVIRLVICFCQGHLALWSWGLFGWPVQVLLIIGCLMIGLSAINNPVNKNAAEQSPEVSQIQNGTNDQIEKLTKLKSLLDSGAITQEEFDNKKKQLLGQ